MARVVPWESTVPAPGTQAMRVMRVMRVTRVTGPTRPHSRIRQRHCVQAALLGVDSTASLVLHAGVGFTMLLAVAASMSTPRGAADRGAAPPRDPVCDEFEDSVRWSVMTILSLFPYFNFVSWAFAAIDVVAAVGLGAEADSEADSEAREEATYFWLLSALYFTPYLIDGFQLDSFTLLTIAIGAAHVYVGPRPLARLRCSALGARRGD